MSYNCFRIFNQNYIDIDILANDYVSSEDSSFTAENVYNLQRRSKVWRSAGFWEIDDSNKTIIFRETVGVDLTATLNTGTYTSFAEFADEIDRALEAAGGSSYVVSQDNLRFKITSDGGGGGGIFEIYLSGTTVASKIGLTSNKTGALNYTMDAIMLHDEEYLMWDMGVATNPTTFLAIDQRNASLQFSPTATIKLQGNETSNFSSPSFETSLTYDDEILEHMTDSGIHTEALRYWRLYLQDQTNPNGYVQLGAVFLGNYFNPAGTAQYPLTRGEVDNSVTVYAEGGQSFSDIKQKTAEYQINMKFLTTADIEAFYQDVFDVFGLSKPFFVSIDTNENFSSDKNRRIIFCKFASRPQAVVQKGNLFTLNFNLREEL